MLELREEDLGRPVGGGREGVHVWWFLREGRRRETMALAWHDLILLDPSVSWPPGFEPRRLEGWGEDSFRLTYLKALARILPRRGVPVPQVTSLASEDRTELPRARIGSTSLQGSLRWTEVLGGPGPLLTSGTSILRAERALVARRGEFEARLVPGMLLLYRSKVLRAVLTTLEVGE